MVSRLDTHSKQAVFGRRINEQRGAAGHSRLRHPGLRAHTRTPAHTDLFLPPKHVERFPHLSWAEAMNDLSERVHLEDETLRMNEAGAPNSRLTTRRRLGPLDQMDLQHYACLHQVPRSSGASQKRTITSYPQKRLDLRLGLTLS